MKPPGSTYRRWVLTLLIICAAAGSVIIGSMLKKGGRFSIPFLAGAAGPAESLTRVIYVTEFLECGDELRESENVPLAEIPAFLENLPRDWAVVKNTEAEVEFYKGLPRYCGTHLRLRLLTLYRGSLSVFRGREPDPAFLVKEYPNITEADLLPVDREYLRKGVVIDVDAPDGAPNLPDDQVDDWFAERLKSELAGITER